MAQKDSINAENKDENFELKSNSEKLKDNCLKADLCLNAELEELKKNIYSKLSRDRFFFVLVIIVFSVIIMVAIFREDPRLKKISDYSQEITLSNDSMKKEIADIFQKVKSLENLQISVNSNIQKSSELQNSIDSLIKQQQVFKNRLEGQKRNNIWNVLEAKYLINLAERKLRIDQDTDTAIALLKDADSIILSLNDARSSKLRESLILDMNVLGNFKKIDNEGIILKINQVIKNIEEMPLEGLERIPVDKDITLSKSYNDWTDNLKVSLDNFLKHFIIIKHKEADAPELLKPENERFLKENIKMYLLVAEKALYNGDIKIYKENLNTVDILIKKYFAMNNQITSNSLNTIQELINSVIEQSNLPDYLQSSVEMDKYYKNLTSDR